MRGFLLDLSQSRSPEGLVKSSYLREEFPKDEPVTLAVLDRDGFHTLEFRCCRTEDGRWVDAKTGFAVDVRPTHWREWLADTD